MPNLANLAQSLRPSNIFTTSRVAVYVLASCAIVLAVVHKAFVFHNNFYSVAIFLSRNSGNALVLVNFAFVLTLLAGKIMQKIFFGSLRDIEVERLYERMWIFLTESLLAFTIFRDEFDVAFGAMFGFLLFVKCFHWLMSDRIEWMDQLPYPGPDLVFHTRLLSLYTVLSLTDLIMLAFAAESILTHGVGGVVLFASEYAILMASAFNCLAKYFVFAYDQHRARRLGGENAPVWENKSMHLFYIDLVTDFLKLITYLVFFVLVLLFYGLPLNIIRDVYITGRSFYQRSRDLIRYRAATRNMDERYPDATANELQLMSDKTCIICREEMVSKAEQEASNAQNGENDATANSTSGPNMTPKKLPCAHIFHFHCLRSWLERQQSCPTCRRGVLDGTEGAAGARAGRPQEGAGPNQRQPGEPGGALFGPIFGEAGVVPPVVPGQVNAGPQRERNPLATYPWPYNQVAAEPQPPLRPPPQFRGFNMGPNGVWHPWVANPRPPLPNDGSEPSNGSLPGAQSKPTNAPDGNSQSSETKTFTSDVEEQTSTQTTISPREAAVQAALRRQGTTKSSTEVMQGPSDTIPQHIIAPPVDPSPTSVSTAAHNASSSAASTSTSLPPPEFPLLIPLFDPVPASTRNTRSSLLPTLSSTYPEQLEDLDTATRDAIDERLRVLDGVNTSLWRSAEELMKLKSVLPPRNTSIQWPKGTSSESTPSEDRNKGKEKEVSTEADT